MCKSILVKLLLWCFCLTAQDRIYTHFKESKFHLEFQQEFDHEVLLNTRILTNKFLCGQKKAFTTKYAENEFLI